MENNKTKGMKERINYIRELLESLDVRKLELKKELVKLCDDLYLERLALLKEEIKHQNDLDRQHFNQL